MYTVYILYSPDHDKIYVGYTSDLTQRLLSHNGLSNKGWTRRYRPWKLIYSEAHNTKGQALMREKQLKGGQGRQWIRETLLKNI